MERNIAINRRNPAEATAHLTGQINHEERYLDGDACANQAESFFYHLRRAEIGMRHH
jgi:hypothetical protein